MIGEGDLHKACRPRMANFLLSKQVEGGGGGIGEEVEGTSGC